ncbi:MAG: succinate dehydrogenase [Candidatus Nephthysia bennettiae]|nr:MAG: succinate dehydrogenase [Candidatus Dormibacteraeota bacterium]
MARAARARRHPAGGVRAFWSSSTGKKLVMATTGAILFGYVVLHLYGNLKLFAGPRAINGWWVFLRIAGEPAFGYAEVLWIVRIVLLLALSLHVTAAYQLTRRDRAARPVHYTLWHSAGSTYASRTMGWSGLFLLLFIIYHIADLTLGTLHPATIVSYREGDVYRNLLGDFQLWYIAVIYIAAALALGLHLYHAVWSMAQTLGLTYPHSSRAWRKAALFFSLALTIGNITIPVVILTGMVH